MKRLFFLALVALAACKNESKPVPNPSASGSAPSASASAAPPGPTHYTGTYTASAGTLYVPDGGEYQGFKFRGEDAGTLGEGAGKLSFTVDPDGGAVSGTLEGPLGPATITGQTRQGELTFHLAPSAGGASDSDATAGPMAFRGTGTATLDGGVASGEIHASSWHADVLRDAKFSATVK